MKKCFFSFLFVLIACGQVLAAEQTQQTVTQSPDVSVAAPAESSVPAAVPVEQPVAGVAPITEAAPPAQVPVPAIEQVSPPPAPIVAASEAPVPPPAPIEPAPAAAAPTPEPVVSDASLPENLEFVSGEVNATDESAKTVTVKLYGDTDEAKNDKILTIKLDDNTDITDGEKDRDLKSLSTGTEVDVEYDTTSNKATYIFVY